MVPGDENRKALERVADGIKQCRQCPLWEGVHNGVPGEGNPHARIMVIGEAPGEQEDLQGRPFVGRSGKILDTQLAGIQIRREDIFIANIVRHRPPANRAPGAGEVVACTPWLELQVRIIHPKILVPLGRYAAGYILGRAGIRFKKVSDICGRSFESSPFGFSQVVFPMLHPAATLHNPNTRVKFREDFLALRGVLDSLGEEENVEGRIP